MATELSGTLAINLEFDLTNEIDLITASGNLSNRNAFSITNGTGADQSTYLFADTRTIAASSNEDLDPATGGGLTDCFANAIAMTKLKCIFVQASEDNTNNVILKRPAANGVPFFDAAGDSIAILPGQAVCLTNFSAAGWTVTADTGDLINIANSAGDTSVTYDIVLIGSGT